jgi:LemA protein
MKNNRLTGYIVGAVLILLGVFIMLTYNSLVKKEEKVKLQWNEVQSAYQRRVDFIPNVVNVVKGQADFEQTTLIKVTEARAKATSVTLTDLSAEKFSEQNKVQDELAGATNKLIIAIEKYPALQGAKAFEGLQTQLEGTERRIKFARKDFNEAIQNYNSAVKSFPTSLVGKVFGFHPQDGFTADAGADKSTEIKF